MRTQMYSLVVGTDGIDLMFQPRWSTDDGHTHTSLFVKAFEDRYIRGRYDLLNGWTLCDPGGASVSIERRYSNAALEDYDWGDECELAQAGIAQMCNEVERFKRLSHTLRVVENAS